MTLTELIGRYERAAMRLALDGTRDELRDYRAYVSSVHGCTEILVKLIAETGKSGKPFKSKEEKKRAKRAYDSLAADWTDFQKLVKSVPSEKAAFVASMKKAGY